VIPALRIRVGLVVKPEIAGEAAIPTLQGLRVRIFADGVDKARAFDLA
jgi:hypothetical protein